MKKINLIPPIQLLELAEVEGMDPSLALFLFKEVIYPLAPKTTR